MAKLTFYQPADMLNAYVYYGYVDSHSASHITITDYDGNTSIYYGSFKYNAYGLAGGRVTAYSSYQDYSLAFTLKGGSVSALTLNNLLNSGDAIGIQKYALRGNDVISGSPSDDTMLGWGGNDKIKGNDGNDYLFGGGGADTLNGGSGADNMSGGAGNDIYYVDDPGDAVTEDLSLAQKGGIDTVNSSVSFTLDANVDRLTLNGTDNVSGAGNALKNVIRGNAGDNSLFGDEGNDSITGGAGADILDGGSGKDTMIGGNGDDSYYVSNTGDVVIETSARAAGGLDTVTSNVSYVLGANLEYLYLDGLVNINGTGNNLANFIGGNFGNNILKGLARNDMLVGLDGNDTLVGGTGSDTLTGGTGTDIFDFNARKESLVANHDVITDFNSLELDRIDLSTIDANTKFTGNQAFSFIGVDTSFSHVAGQLSFDSTSHTLFGDVNGNGIADFSIVLTGISSLTSADFIL